MRVGIRNAARIDWTYYHKDGTLRAAVKKRLSNVLAGFNIML